MRLETVRRERTASPLGSPLGATNNAWGFPLFRQHSSVLCLRCRFMDMKDILSQLKAERERVDKAIAALEGLDSTGATAAPAKVVRRGRRRMSAAARKRISDAAKARWAARRKGKKA